MRDFDGLRAHGCEEGIGGEEMTQAEYDDIKRRVCDAIASGLSVGALVTVVYGRERKVAGHVLSELLYAVPDELMALIEMRRLSVRPTLDKPHEEAASDGSPSKAEARAGNVKRGEDGKHEAED
jgi:hypothetical protein